MSTPSPEPDPELGPLIGPPFPLAERMGLVLRSFRLARGDTLKEVADRAGMKPPNISDVESGRANVTLERLERIAKAYGAEVVTVLAPARD